MRKIPRGRQVPKLILSLLLYRLYTVGRKRKEKIEQIPAQDVGVDPLLK